MNVYMTSLVSTNRITGVAKVISVLTSCSAQKHISNRFKQFELMQKLFDGGKHTFRIEDKTTIIGL